MVTRTITSKGHIIIFVFAVLLVAMFFFRWEPITNAIESDIDPEYGLDDVGFRYERHRMTGLLRTYYIVDDVYASFSYQNSFVMKGLNYIVNICFLLLLILLDRKHIYKPINYKTAFLLTALIILTGILLFRWETVSAYPEVMKIIEYDRLTTLVKTSEIRGGNIYNTIYQNGSAIILSYVAIYVGIIYITFILVKELLSLSDTS